MLKGIEVVHYKRDLSIPLGEDAQKSLAYLYMMLEGIAQMGLPVENTYEQCKDKDWQHIIFPETSNLAFQNALLGCGFTIALETFSEKDLDFHERLKRGETLVTKSHHTGFTSRPKKGQ